MADPRYPPYPPEWWAEMAIDMLNMVSHPVDRQFIYNLAASTRGQDHLELIIAWAAQQHLLASDNEFEPHELLDKPPILESMVWGIQIRESWEKLKMELAPVGKALSQVIEAFKEWSKLFPPDGKKVHTKSITSGPLYPQASYLRLLNIYSPRAPADPDLVYRTWKTTSRRQQKGR